VDQLWKDLHSDKIRIRLDKGDKDFISDMTAEDIRPIVVKKIPVPPPKPKPLPRPSNPAPKAAQPKNQAIKKAYKPIDAITAEKIRSGEVSIKDLQMQNVINTTPTTSSIPLTDPAQKATLKEIQAHMHGSI
jgi:outer membrane biosynthesis protein TonB